MNAQGKWEKKIVNFAEMGNSCLPRPLKEKQTLWCEPEGVIGQKHQFQTDKIWFRIVKGEEDLIFAICPEHQTPIRIRIVDKC
jgi:hypothetical protein